MKKEKLNFDMETYVKNNQNFRICLLGLTGAGKTYWSRKFITKFLNLKKRNVICCDTKQEFSDMKIFNPLLDLPQKGILRRVLKIKVKDTIFDKPKEVAEYVAAVSWFWKPCLCYLEEVAYIVESKSESLPTSHENIFKVLQLGRSQLTDILVATQKATQLHEAFIDEATDIFLFAVSASESAKLEEKLHMPKGSLTFDIPDLSEKALADLKPSEWKDLYSFVRINQMRQAIWYNPLDFNPKIKTAKSEFKNEKSTTN